MGHFHELLETHESRICIVCKYHDLAVSKICEEMISDFLENENIRNSTLREDMRYQSRVSARARWPFEFREHVVRGYN